MQVLLSVNRFARFLISQLQNDQNDNSLNRETDIGVAVAAESVRCHARNRTEQQRTHGIGGLEALHRAGMDCGIRQISRPHRQTHGTNAHSHA